MPHSSIPKAKPLATGRGCGKLYLVGEYAVMAPGGAAVIAGVDRFVTATAYPVEPQAMSGRVFSSYYEPAGRSFELEFPRPEEGRDHQPSAVPEAVTVRFAAATDLVAHCVKIAYQVLARRRVPLRAVVLDIHSDLDDAATGKKYGLGSSGAVCVAVIDAIVRAHSVELTRIEVFKAAYIATYWAGIAGSGGDIACSSHGGVVAYRRPDPKAVQSLIDADAVTAMEKPWPGLLLESRADSAGLRLLVGWTGQPVKTDDQLAAADSASAVGCAQAEAVVKRFPSQCRAQAERLWTALEQRDTEQALAAVRATRALLRGFAQAKSLNIETELLGALADIAEAHGAAGKSSGSGGGDCGIALAPADVDTVKLEDDWVSAGVEPLHLALAPLAGTFRGDLN